MTPDIYIVKTRTNKHKQTVNDVCGLNTVTVIQLSVINTKKSICISRAKIYTSGGVDKIEIGPDRNGLDHGSDHRNKSFKEKKIQKNQIVHERVSNK